MKFQPLIKQQLQQLRFISRIPVASGNAAKRPLSPHLTIYQKQLTATMSIFGRITGAGLTACVYAGGISCALVPCSSGAVIAGLAQLPVWLLLSGKFVLAAPFTYHTFNGIRHLLWDTKHFLSLKSVYSTGYAVCAATLISTGLLVGYY